jgi:hypothetical protein
MFADCLAVRESQGDNAGMADKLCHSRGLIVSFGKAVSVNN